VKSRVDLRVGNSATTSEFKQTRDDLQNLETQMVQFQNMLQKLTGGNFNSGKRK